MIGMRQAVKMNDDNVNPAELCEATEFASFVAFDRYPFEAYGRIEGGRTAGLGFQSKISDDLRPIILSADSPLECSAYDYLPILVTDFILQALEL